MTRVASLFAGLFLLSLPLPGSGGDESEKAGAAEEQVLREAKLPTDNKSLVAALRQRVLPDANQKELERLLAQLGSEKFVVREKAHAALLAQGLNALPVLRQAEHASDVELKKQAEGLREELETRLKADEPIQLATVRLLGVRKPVEATAALLAYLPFAPDENVADEVRNALAAVNRRAKETDPALWQALSDKSPARRGAAAETLCRAGAKDPRVADLLKDDDPAVRLRVGQALLRQKDVAAVPVLIELLGRLPADQLWQTQDLLTQLAGESSPAVSLGDDPTSRGRCRDAWREWWSIHEKDVDLARLDRLDAYLGYTLIVQQVFDRNPVGGKGVRIRNVGQVLELDANKKPRWKLEVPYYTVDAHVVAGDRVLIAEYQGRRVSERTKKGEVVWEKTVNGNPIAVERLKNGNTFIVMQNLLLEVARDGHEVWSLPRQGFDVFKARKLPNGDVALVTNRGQFQRLDRDHKVLKSFQVGPVNSQFGSMDVLPTGGVVVGLFGSNRVVEFNANGKQVWSANVPWPSSVVRLPNGRTLVASQNNNRVVEVDRAGRVVWNYTTGGQVYQARRR
jgi:outer membrane protein assembly factor BamB